jgi:5'-phosphate synthase pdxT subunit
MVKELELAKPLIGVLAVQGAFAEHADALVRVGADAQLVRTAGDLVDLDGLVIPGGESTTLGLLGTRTGLLEDVREAVSAGLPVFGTCAGMIMLANETTGGAQPLIGGLDIRVRRNAFGRQVASFEADVELSAFPEAPFPGVFIRAPWAEETGPDIEILARHDGHVVAARTDVALVTAFHPELTADIRVHDLFLRMVREAGASADTDAPPIHRKEGERVRAQ